MKLFILYNLYMFKMNKRDKIIYVFKSYVYSINFLLFLYLLGLFFWD